MITPEDWAPARDIVTAVLLLIGALMSMAAGVGLWRYPDLLSRMHAATKPQVLGLFCLLLAVVVQLNQWVWLPVFALAWGLQLLTSPVSAHMVGRAAYRTKHLRQDILIKDELKGVVDRAIRNDSAKK
ncbi:multicomponent Na+:H+ antiporter subunit G [Neomicrococcus aestuarii]|uniref:Multicomponent Na+:H+ antiporter subunit G n=1 Tax=Neomicrococcus aestuarii TaxID=556325 RepID=A0A7W8X1X3_9MICC|nr:monovalent cation/H(+) antiporter subunit G [Neomicrococcus aestuarii]MBB5513274.1 multicomponent Na+:H+ antiporter subunit G [Neomicrococcus aestuarii]